MVHISTATGSSYSLPIFRCYDPLLDAETEVTLVRKAQNGDNQAGCVLHRQFHGAILGFAGKRVPSDSTFWRRAKGKTRQYTSELFDDLVAVGHLAPWQSILNFDLSGGYRLWTFASKRVAGALSDYAKQWRKGGITGETRTDRWLFHHANATPEQLLAASNKFGIKKQVFKSLQEAADYLNDFNGRYSKESIHLDQDKDRAEYEIGPTKYASMHCRTPVCSLTGRAL